MKKSHYSDSYMMSILKQVEGGTPVPDLCREHGMSSATFINGDLAPLIAASIRKYSGQQNAYVERFNRTVRYD